MSKTAILLAAGRAERMRPLSGQRPKAMFLLAGKPVIQHVLEAALALDLDEAVIVVPAGDATIQSFVGDGQRFGLSVRYVEQDAPLGTADAVRRVGPLDGGAHVLPCAAFLEAATLASLASAKETTVLVATATSGHTQGIPAVRGGRMAGLSFEQPTVGASRVLTQIAWLDADTHAALLASDEVNLDAFLAARAVDHAVRVLDADGAWEPIVDPWDILRINEHALGGVEVHVGANVDVHESAVLIPPVWLGDGAQIGENSVIGPYVTVRTNGRIGALCEIRDSSINNNVRIDSRSVMRGAILDDGVVIGPNFAAPRGVIVGPDAIIGSNVSVDERCIVDEQADVASGSVLDGS